MKEIKHIQQLQLERKRLLQQQKDLEKSMRFKWEDLKETLAPANIANKAINKIINNETTMNHDDKSILNSTFTFGFTLLAKKIAEKTWNKLERI